MWLLINIKANMKTKLIKINEEHYIIVDGFEVKKGDFMYDIDGDIGIAIGKDKSQWEGNMKITHSTQLIDGDEVGACFTKIKQLSLSEVKELFGYSVEKLVDESFENMGYHSTVTPYEEDQFKLGYKLGFSAHKELTKDKLFTLEDMINFAVNCFNDNYDEDISFYKRVKINIEYLKPKTEWEVEFINGKLTLKQ